MHVILLRVWDKTWKLMRSTGEATGRTVSRGVESQMAFTVKFWGVRGSIACPSPNHVVYGGNTSCVEVIAGERHIILDAGTGIRNLGQRVIQEGIQSSVLLLTHTHWDHINGFPFFAPLFQKNRTFDIYAGHLYDTGGVQSVLASSMSNPMFPVPLEALQATLRFHDFRAGEDLELGPDVRVRTVLLNHPNGATGYRIEYDGRAVCYVTDTEHVPGELDETVLGLIAGADLVIYDCTYTDAEYPSHVGWGHSTWQQGVRLCREAAVKRLAIFHHDPDHDDTFMAELEDEARRTWEATFVAREGMQITVGA
ncbi:Phosphoribosyl 1,2-cyclic phosphodiesterase [Caenispirillum bisanense]|uniref:Phosphoribosyl 1,2-cyclic phosphodiesterase n=2 Tax=Caenispirillum bisanense TaxID=414052 RepID=A0A286GMS3_9PROT|nr:Phosphoribosyl 1,2-cyclic phosphodiesterase [Caenispirillum bisanense]